MQRNKSTHLKNASQLKPTGAKYDILRLYSLGGVTRHYFMSSFFAFIEIR